MDASTAAQLASERKPDRPLPVLTGKQLSQFANANRVFGNFESEWGEMAVAINEFFGAEQPDPVDVGMESMGFTKAEQPEPAGDGTTDEQPEPEQRTGRMKWCPQCGSLWPGDWDEHCTCGVWRGALVPVRVPVEENKR